MAMVLGEKWVEVKGLTFMVISREDNGLAGLPVEVGGLDILPFFFLYFPFLFPGILRKSKG